MGSLRGGGTDTMALAMAILLPSAYPGKRRLVCRVLPRCLILLARHVNGSVACRMLGNARPGLCLDEEVPRGEGSRVRNGCERSQHESDRAARRQDVQLLLGGVPRPVQAESRSLRAPERMSTSAGAQ